MTLIEALKTERPYKREGWKSWINPNDSKALKMEREDVLATDYVVKPEEYTVQTNEDRIKGIIQEVNDLLQCVYFMQKIPEGCGLMIDVEDAIRRGLGLPRR